ncbi:helix-turn-helix domain-containing protein [Methyloferula stellata]|uniref:helix-turn-helix domain-containing protein n=1 Tax=Methyloferula stellata TaxID=876270 RepID=UPI001375A29A|nr:helix-turn-helix domain-containing protein [Methyloferula stellata]
MSVDPPAGATSYRASLSVSIFAALSKLTFNADSSPIRRLQATIRKVAWDQYWIYRENGRGVQFQFGDRAFNTLPGDIMVADADTPFHALATHSYHHDLWMIPRPVLDRHLPPLPRPLAIHLPASAELSVLLVAYLDALSQMDDLSDEMSALVADHLARLVAIACGSVSRGHGEALGVARLEQARQYIEQNLTLHDLAPEKVAAALKISVRQLHLYFEPSGETFSQYARRRRLEECRATLENPLFARRSVAELAFASGFSSLPTFYRAFHKAFGIAPGDVRVIAMESVKQREEE